MFPVRSAAIQKIRNRSDMAESMFITDDEIIDLANDQLELAYHACVSAYGDSTFATELFINVPASTGQATSWPSASTTRYHLPADFGRLLRSEFAPGTITSSTVNGTTTHLMQTPNTHWTPMHPFELAGDTYNSTPTEWQQRGVEYWIQAHPGPTLPSELWANDTTSHFWISFLPVPKTAITVHLIYVPTAPQWGNDDSDLIRLPDLAWKFVRESTAADILEKQRSDSTQLRANAAQYLADLTGAKLHPDFANPPMTVDVYGHGNGTYERDIW